MEFRPQNPETNPPVPVPERGPESLEAREARPAVESPPPVEKAEAVIAPPPISPAKPVVLPPSKDPYLMRVERILEDNLLEVYVSLPPARRARFKAGGEATALKIRGLIERSKVQAKSILRLIWRWLKRIPGANRYFLEQEAKIKTDRLMALAAARRQDKEKGGDEIL